MENGSKGRGVKKGKDWEGSGEWEQGMGEWRQGKDWEVSGECEQETGETRDRGRIGKGVENGRK